MTDSADSIGNLPMIPEGDGFDDREQDGRIIKGVLLKCRT